MKQLLNYWWCHVQLFHLKPGIGTTSYIIGGARHHLAPPHVRPWLGPLRNLCEGIDILGILLFRLVIPEGRVVQRPCVLSMCFSIKISFSNNLIWPVNNSIRNSKFPFFSFNLNNLIGSWLVKKWRVRDDFLFYSFFTLITFIWNFKLF